MPALIDSVLGLLVVSGALMLFSSSIKILRAGSLFARVQAVGKAGAVGAVLVLLAVALAAGDFAIFMKAAGACVLVIISATLVAQWLACMAVMEGRDRKL